MNTFVKPTSVAVALVIAYTIQASEETLGPKGINSTVTGLDGMGSAIGQVEGGRPGKPPDTEQVNDKVVPVGVFARDRAPMVNEGVSNHALWVASVMISQQTTLGGGQSKPIGVAQQADLFSSAFVVAPVGDLQQDAAIAAQTLTNTVYATNMSFGLPLDGGFQLDGTSTLTSFVDWSTVSQEVLYVVAGNEATKTDPVPTDNFNGITVAASGRADDGFFRKVSALNVYDEAVDAIGPRTSTLILAPGELIDVAGANGVNPSQIESSGTSYAAPHVTGTLALLQQRANTTAANRHLTKKAVILNSADKIKDIIGMDRTVIKSNKSDWFGSAAYTDPAIPVDREMGVGELDAKRAVQQLDAGQHRGGGTKIGWDYFYQDDPFSPNGYTLSLDPGDWVSATLVWDRDVELNSSNADYQRGDGFTDFGFANLDLYLVHYGQGIDAAVDSSTSTAWNLEHIFFKVPSGGDYQLLVTTDSFDLVPYALAWWAGPDERGKPGDFNKDGKVDAADYIVWRQSDSSNEGYDEWRANFGNTYGSGSSLGPVPEPSSISLTLLGLLVCLPKGRRHPDRQT